MSLRICIAGAGAVGGVLAVRLAQAGHAVSVLARGATLAAIIADGLQLNNEAPVELSASEAAAAPADVLFISVKAHSLRALLPAVRPAIGPETIVVPTLNGIPWWYFQGLPGRLTGEVVHSVDPSGELVRALAWEQLIGAVIYMTAETPSPGRVQAGPPFRIVLGEPNHTSSSRLARLCDTLQGAGFDAVPTDRIRDEIWTKLLVNLASNPLSVVADATLGEIFGHPDLREAVMAVMREVMTVGAWYGVRFTIDPDRLFALGRARGTFRTSMLQDYDKGRPVELAGIGDAVLEFAARYDLPMPATQLILSLTRFRTRIT